MVISKFGISMLPNRIFGIDTNELLAYHTVKYVSIYDRHLGCLYYFFCLLIVAWVVGFQIVYGNEHYQLYDVKGTATMTMQQPTVNHCNPRLNSCHNALKKPEDLPYCKEYAGATTIPQGECMYADLVSLTPSHRTPGAIFIPTRSDRTIQVKGCGYTRLESKYCSHLWDNIETHENTYVADIEDFTVRISSTYTRKGIIGSSHQHTGYYYECKDGNGKTIATEPCLGKLVAVPICPLGKNGKAECDPSKLELDEEPTVTAGLIQADQAEEFGVDSLAEDEIESRRSVSKYRRVKQGRIMRNYELDQVARLSAAQKHADISNPPGQIAQPFAVPEGDGGGDAFTIGKILQLAGMDLDENVMKNQTLRQLGTSIQIQVEYQNLKPWSSTLRSKHNVTYIYRVLSSPIKAMKQEVYASVQPENEKQRAIEERYGLHLQAEVSGTFGVFNIVYLLVMLTTSLALLSAAKSIVDAIAIYVPSKRQDAYVSGKYQIVEGFESDNEKDNRFESFSMPGDNKES